MALIQIVYVSSLKTLRLESEISNILESSIRHNKENDITGMLLYAGGNFLQVLEGESDRIGETFQRISIDPRHHNIIDIINDPVTEREFSQWSMGFYQLTPEQIQSFPDSVLFFDFGADPQSIKARPGLALSLLRDFRKNCR